MGRAFEYRKAAKMKRWGTMSRVFPKLGKIITMAAKDGGMDPDMNPKLRTAILNAKAQNMPKDNIDAAIKRAAAKDLADIKELTYDVKAHHGVQMIIECATDNNTRTVANVKAILSRNGGEMLTSGSLNFMFTKKSVFVFDKTENMDIEELDKEIVRIYGEFTSFGDLTHALEDKGIEVKKATIEFIANTPIELNDDQIGEIDSLIDKLEDDEDVQNVYTNIN